VIPAEPFIRRPVATSLLTAALALSGVLAFRLLPVSPLPQVDFPTIVVNASLPGASPETMASGVATPLERQFGRIAGVSEMTSSSRLGSTSVVLQFVLDRDINAAARDVQASINAARGQLPPDLPGNPTYRKVNPADAPAMILSMTSDTVPRARLYDFASSVVAQRLSQIEGVGQVNVGGGALPAVRVELNPRTLAKYNLGFDQVRTVLGAANANRPKGQVSDATTTFEIGATDQLMKAADYEPLIVAYRNGAPIRLADLGSVRDSVQDIRVTGLTNGKPAVQLQVFRQTGANIIETVDRVKALLPEFRALLPAAVDLNAAIDRTTTIRASVKDVERTLVLAILLVVLVVFVFLRSPRTTIIPGIAVPLSLLGTFGAMYFLGYSLDNLSLMALTISTGFVVDDAIVVIENVNRHLAAGLAPIDAALLGAREIGFTVVSMSASLIAVFIPILLMGGLVGRLFREFSVTLSVAVAVSMVVSLTTTPMMCAHLLRPESESRHGQVYRATERAFEELLRAYDRSLTWMLRRWRLTLAIAIATVAVNVALYIAIPKGFFPQQDTGMLAGTVQAPQDTSYHALSAMMTDFVHTLLADPAIDSVVAFTGGGGTGANSARMFIALKPLAVRKEHADAVIARLRRRFGREPRASLFFQAVQDIRVGGRSGNAQYQFTLQADNLSDLNHWAPILTTRLRQTAVLADVSSDQENRGLQTTIAIDRDAAARLGVQARSIDEALYDAFGQRLVSTIYTSLNQYHVVMEAAPDDQERPEGLQQIYVRSTSGALVPFSTFATYQPDTAPLSVNHQSQFPATTLTFNLSGGASLSDAVTAIDGAMRDLAVPATVHGSFQGTASVFQSSLASEPWLILAALLTVYIVLGILYESLIHPLTILSTLPSAGLGATLALMLCRTEFTIIALIGVILLIGIVKKNAIMMIDVALVAERTRGLTPEAAIHEACLLRFRPILMTTMAAMLGALPMALGTGVGAEMRRPLGIAVVGGLLVSQLLTLYTTPVVYTILDRLRWHRASAHDLRLSEA
jgi:multidrug efflux pump